jgi:hypothetical protein
MSSPGGGQAAAQQWRDGERVPIDPEVGKHRGKLADLCGVLRSFGDPGPCGEAEADRMPDGR